MHHKIPSKEYFASGKLLLFGEYLVLLGAKSLALPLNKGQSLKLTSREEEGILWEAKEQGKPWLKIGFHQNLEIKESNDLQKSAAVQKLLLFIQKATPHLSLNHLHFQFDLDFKRRYGWGTSSTLVSLLSQWCGLNPYDILHNSFGGSGYDIAAATASTPFIYTTNDRFIQEVTLPRSITKHLLFVYTGQKQNTLEGVAHFQRKKVTPQQINTMNLLVENAIKSTSIAQWEDLMKKSEELLASILKITPIKESAFPDFPYPVKSLGAWGGDFIMVSCRDIDEGRHYFQSKNKYPIFTYQQLIK